MYAPPKSVRCLELGQEFPSIKAAAEALGINRGNIRRSLQTGAPVPQPQCHLVAAFNCEFGVSLTSHMYKPD
eukprot:g39225.t1